METAGRSGARRSDAHGYGVVEDDAEAVPRLDVRLKYANGEGVVEDDAEAVRWYRLAADQGHADAQYMPSV